MKSYEERELSSALRSLAGTIEVPAGNLRPAHRTGRSLATGFAGIALALLVAVAAIAAPERRAFGDRESTPHPAADSVQECANHRGRLDPA